MKDKTKLPPRSDMKAKALAAALIAAAAGGTLAACAPATDPAGVTTTENMPEDIASLSEEQRAGRLVRTQEECIARMVELGMESTEATRTCQDLTGAALAAVQQQGGTTVVRESSSSGMTNALLWYMILTNNGRPTTYVYQGSPDRGFNRIDTGGDMSRAPSALTPNQSTYLAADPADRSAVNRTLASRPGVRTVPVTTHTVTAPAPNNNRGTVGASNRGGMGGPGVSTGG